MRRRRGREGRREEGVKVEWGGVHKGRVRVEQVDDGREEGQDVDEYCSTT